MRSSHRSGRAALAGRNVQPPPSPGYRPHPTLAGWVVLDVLKHDLATRHIPVDIVSGATDVARGRRMGAIHTLSKPADVTAIRSMLRATAEFLRPGPRQVLSGGCRR